jgi:hypothetical protein
MHVKAVRNLEPHLRASQAILVIENNYGGSWITAPLVEALSKDRDMGDFKWLDIEQALRNVSPNAGGRKRSVASQMTDGVLTTDGNRTGVVNKQIYFASMQAMLLERRLRVHERFVSLSSRRPDDEEDFLTGQQQQTNESALLHMLGLDAAAVATSAARIMEVMRDPFAAAASPLTETFRVVLRKRQVDKLHHQFRGTMLIYKELFNARTDEKRTMRRISGKESSGPHDKKDDLVTALGQLVFSLAAVVSLPEFSDLRQHMGLPDVDAHSSMGAGFGGTRV